MMCAMPSHKEIDRRFRRLNPHSSIGSGLTWTAPIARSTPIVRAWLAILLAAIPLVLAGPASAASPPVNTVAPTLSGLAKNGVALSTTSGTWTGVATITYAYQWQLSSDGGASWTNISGATTTSYTPPAGSTDKQARALVTATNGDGTTQATSPTSAPILEGLPAATVTTDGSSTPAVSGEANAQAAPADVSGGFLPWNRLQVPLLGIQVPGYADDVCDAEPQGNRSALPQAEPPFEYR